MIDSDTTHDPAAKHDPSACTLCGGTSALSQKGIFLTFVKPHWWAICIILLGLLLAIVRGSRGWLLLSLLGYLLPLAMADLRLLLYPYAAIGALLGKRVNCPTCNPSSNIFKRI